MFMGIKNYSKIMREEISKMGKIHSFIYKLLLFKFMKIFHKKKKLANDKYDKNG